ncbi:hypothetical protein AB4Z21_26120, partial [Paenibacillus sp. MCAF20]
EEDRLELELVSCYSDVAELSSFKRQFVWRKLTRPVLELTDSFRFTDKAQPIVETVITRCKPSLLEDGRIRLQGAQHDVAFEFEAGRYDVTIDEVSFSNHFGQVESYYRIQLTVKDVGSSEPVYKLQFKF